jgi:hypothetical protein
MFRLHSQPENALGDQIQTLDENQSFRATGLSLITAAIVRWSTVARATGAGVWRAVVPEDRQAHLAPLGGNMSR